MTDYRVDCITKPDRTSRSERIQRLGGATPYPWNYSEDEVIALIKLGHTFHTYAPGYRAEVIIAHNGTTEYLKTDADGILTDNLLRLEECR